MSTKKNHILIVDDEAEICQLSASILTKENYQVKTCQEQTEAIDLIKAEHFSLCLLDVNLAGDNGFEIADFIQTHQKETQIIMMSAYEGLLEEEKLKSPQIQQFLKKPFTKKQLLQVVQESI